MYDEDKFFYWRYTMNVHKYLLAVVLGLGICGGISVEFAQGMNQQQNQQNAAANVVRWYANNNIGHNMGVFGNVLAFECNVRVNDEQNWQNAIVVLQNGDIRNQPVNQNMLAGNLPIYRVPFESIVRSVNGLGGNRPFAAAGDDIAYGYAVMAQDLPIVSQNVELDDGHQNRTWNPNRWGSRGGQFINAPENRVLTCPWCLNWWGYAAHTEVQFCVMRAVAARNHQDTITINNVTNLRDNQGNITITIRNTDITNVQHLHSLFEPCKSCRCLTYVNDHQNFHYYAIDGDMYGNDDDNGGRQHVLDRDELWRRSRQALRKDDYRDGRVLLQAIDSDLNYRRRRNANDQRTLLGDLIDDERALTKHIREIDKRISALRKLALRPGDLELYDELRKLRDNIQRQVSALKNRIDAMDTQNRKRQYQGMSVTNAVQHRERRERHMNDVLHNQSASRPTKTWKS